MDYFVVKVAQCHDRFNSFVTDIVPLGTLKRLCHMPKNNNHDNIEYSKDLLPWAYLDVGSHYNFFACIQK